MKRDFEFYMSEFVVPIVALVAIAWVVYLVFEEGSVAWETNNVPGRVAK